jgi:hypothetical protein
VIGTSNSVFSDGYTSILREVFPEVINRSIGFSSSHVLTYRKDEVDFGRHDVCIIECACNDGSLFLAGFTSETLIEQSLEDLLDKLEPTGCLPFVLILPITYLYPSGGLVRATYRKFCERHGLPYLDVYELFARQVAHWDKASIFLDPMHIHRSLARAVGSLIASSLPDIAALARVNRVSRKSGVSQRYLPIAATIADQTTLHERSTSLDRAKVLDLGNGASLEVPVRDNEEVVALVCDLYNSAAYLTVSGRTIFTACLRTDYFKGDGVGLVTSIIPVPTPVSAQDGLIRLHTSPSAEAQLSFVAKDYVAERGGASVIGLILRRPVADLAAKAVFEHAFNLSHEASRPVLDQLAHDLAAIEQPQALSA